MLPALLSEVFGIGTEPRPHRGRLLALVGLLAIAPTCLVGCECVEEHSYQGWDITWLSEKQGVDDRAHGDTLAGLSVEMGTVEYYFENAFFQPFGWSTPADPVYVWIGYRPEEGIAGGYENCSFYLDASPLSDIDRAAGEESFEFSLTLDGDDVRQRCQASLDERAAHPDFQLDETWDDWVSDADFPDLDERLLATYYDYSEHESCD